MSPLFKRGEGVVVVSRLNQITMKNALELIARMGTKMGVKSAHHKNPQQLCLPVSLPNIFQHFVIWLTH